ncbi:glutathione S-transferase family protein [Caulobacter mirabilis]|uniref:Glutathione S-transferase n=1 Tax=Caulobacter mirabilis TaxID=69666 RepID=A0A2D2AWF6_9CAUL|nr:glutathione S-transferase family protein [Caulobacter mirabilis]ATQ42348.1 glutathione S-transferase [Caulobacter mirabilis]
MIVYGATLSPFVRKTLAAAAEKGIEVEHRVPRPGVPDPDFQECSPFGKIPGFRDGDFCISDSSAIIAYFEAIKPEPALIPAEAKARARTVWFEEFADTILVGAAGKMFFNRIVVPMFMGREGDAGVADAAERKEMPPILDYLERVVPAPGGHLVGDGLTLADLAVASPFANLRHLNFDLSKWPKTKAWADAVLDRPSFARMVEGETRLLNR